MARSLSKSGIFIFNERQEELLKQPPEVRYKVLDAMFMYNLYGELPTDPMSLAYFGKFKNDIDEGKAKKKDISDKRKEAIAKRWGNKPVESLQEEKGTEIPPTPQKPEIHPQNGQRTEDMVEPQYVDYDKINKLLVESNFNIEEYKKNRPNFSKEKDKEEFHKLVGPYELNKEEQKYFYNRYIKRF